MAVSQSMNAVLLVEDNAEDVYLIREAFHATGLEKTLHIVPDGVEALAFLRREAPYEEAEQPDIVLLDLNMPRKNGFETLKEIKRDPQISSLPILILTTSSLPEDMTNCYAQGAASYLIKPNHFTLLKDMVRSVNTYWTEVSSLPR